MSLDHLMLDNVNKVSIKNYQPIFPLVYDSTTGPYKSITSHKESIQRDFQYLLLTNPGEWPMNPDLGIGVRRYLFESYDSPELGKIEERIRSQLSKYLPFPYIQFISAKFISTPDQRDIGTVKLKLKYAILASQLVTAFVDNQGFSVKDLPSNGDLNSYLGKNFEKFKTSLASNMRNI